MSGAPPGAPQIVGYRYVRLISASGGYGDVHLFEDELDRPVAVKVIREADLSPTVVQRFMGEAKTMASLEHPNIVRVYRAATTVDGRPFIAMQLCEQQTMEDRAAGGRLGVAEVLRTGIVIGGAIETAHRAGLIHRDIKPANILIQPGGAPGLTDFGVAAQVSGSAASDAEVGVSIPWSPPEMLWSDTPGSVASDVYSLAATIWHLLVGRSPYSDPRGDNRRAALMSRIRDLPPPPTHRADVPDALERVLRQALDKHPERRPPSALDLVRSLQVIEADLRLPRTDPVVVERRAPAPPVAPPPTSQDPPAASTQLRPRTAGFVPPPTPEARRDDSLGGDRTQLRPGTARLDAAATGTTASGRHPEPDATQLRARTTEISVPDAGDPRPQGRSRGLLIGLGVGALLVAGVGGYALLGDRAPTTKGTPTAGATVQDSAPVDDVIPVGPVTVKGAVAGGKATFTWEYSGRLAGDQYRYQLDGKAPALVALPKLTVPVSKGQKVCLTVQVLRSQGGTGSREPTAPTCVTG